MSLTPINTHAADALARLLEQYKNSPRLKAIIESLSGQIQELEDSLQAVDVIRGINDASGTNLDRIGASVGVVRSSDTADDFFRILILGKISANVSQGETESVIATYLLLTQASQVTLTEIFPAAISVYSNGTVDPDLPDYIGTYLKQASPAAVSLDSFGIYPEEHFGFSSNPFASGFGDDNDPDVGGGLATQLG